MPKITCPSGTHEDKTPSCEVYPDGSGFCFACRVRFSDLGLDVKSLPASKPKEDIAAKIASIKALPKMPHRGLEFHFDDTGYYVLWPKENYYKCRKWSTQSGSKYLGPAGHRNPLFFIRASQQTKQLIIVEGEINALSLNCINLESNMGDSWDILCPGGVSNFTDSQMRQYLPEFAYYTRIVICADSDTVGTIAALNLKALLLPFVPNIAIKLFHKPRDCNQILVESGTHALREEIQST